jgi:hypothetical protein
MHPSSLQHLLIQAQIQTNTEAALYALQLLQIRTCASRLALLTLKVATAAEHVGGS